MDRFQIRVDCRRQAAQRWLHQSSGENQHVCKLDAPVGKLGDGDSSHTILAQPPRAGRVRELEPQHWSKQLCHMTSSWLPGAQLVQQRSGLWHCVSTGRLCMWRGNLQCKPAISRFQVRNRQRRPLLNCQVLSACSIAHGRHGLSCAISHSGRMGNGKPTSCVSSEVCAIAGIYREPPSAPTTSDRFLFALTDGPIM